LEAAASGVVPSTTPPVVTMPAQVPVPPRSRGSWSELLSPAYRSRTLIVWVLWATAYLVANSLNNWMPTLYTTVYHLGIADALRAASMTNVAQVALLLLAALVIDRTGRKQWMIGAFGFGAVLLSVLAQDDDEFARRIAQLQSYYAYPAAVPDSPLRLKLTALNLLRLLATNKLDEFHMALELIPSAELADAFVAHTVQLEQWLMEGSYSKLFAAHHSATDPVFKCYMDMLQTTVRSEIAACAEKAYPSLGVADATVLLRLGSPAAMSDFAAGRSWTLSADGARYVFLEGEAPKKQAVPSMSLIVQSLAYAKELERIV